MEKNINIVYTDMILKKKNYIVNDYEHLNNVWRVILFLLFWYTPNLIRRVTRIGIRNTNRSIPLKLGLDISQTHQTHDGD